MEEACCSLRRLLRFVHDKHVRTALQVQESPAVPRSGRFEGSTLDAPIDKSVQLAISRVALECL